MHVLVFFDYRTPSSSEGVRAESLSYERGGDSSTLVLAVEPAVKYCKEMLSFYVLLYDTSLLENSNLLPNINQY